MNIREPYPEQYEYKNLVDLLTPRPRTLQRGDTNWVNYFDKTSRGARDKLYILQNARKLLFAHSDNLSLSHNHGSSRWFRFLLDFGIKNLHLCEPKHKKITVNSVKDYIEKYLLMPFDLLFNSTSLQNYVEKCCENPFICLHILHITIWEYETAVFDEKSFLGKVAKIRAQANYSLIARYADPQFCYTMKKRPILCVLKIMEIMYYRTDIVALGICWELKHILYTNFIRQAQYPKKMSRVYAAYGTDIPNQNLSPKNKQKAKRAAAKRTEGIWRLIKPSGKSTMDKDNFNITWPPLPNRVLFCDVSSNEFPRSKFSPIVRKRVYEEIQKRKIRLMCSKSLNSDVISMILSFIPFSSDWGAQFLDSKHNFQNHAVSVSTLPFAKSRLEKQRRASRMLPHLTNFHINELWRTPYSAFSN